MPVNSKNGTDWPNTKYNRINNEEQPSSECPPTQSAAIEMCDNAERPLAGPRGDKPGLDGWDASSRTKTLVLVTADGQDHVTCAVCWNRKSRRQVKRDKIQLKKDKKRKSTLRESS